MRTSTCSTISSLLTQDPTRFPISFRFLSATRNLTQKGKSKRKLIANNNNLTESSKSARMETILHSFRHTFRHTITIAVYHSTYICRCGFSNETQYKWKFLSPAPTKNKAQPLLPSVCVCECIQSSCTIILRVDSDLFLCAAPERIRT